MPSFGKLLETDRSVPLQIRNLQILVAGLSKESKDLAPTFFSEIFQNKVFSITCVTLLSSLFQTLKALFIVTESLSYLGLKI